MINICGCTSSQFLEIVKRKKIICFCAGEKFDLFCQNYPVAKQVEYIVDNFKGGAFIMVEGRKVPVISPEQMKPISEEEILVLTSVKAADEVVKQMDESSFFDGKKVYVPELFTEEVPEFVFPKEGKPQIPKIIHYCWFGNTPVPKHFQNNIDTWKRCCPDYEIKQWNENNYDITKNRYMRQAYEKKKWGFVPDYARLDIINSNGGIYLDTDVQLIKSLDALLVFEMFCGFESKTRINFGQGFGAKKGHPVIRAMLDGYAELEFINADGSMNIEPSPVYQTKTLEQFGVILNGTLQKKEDFIVFPPEYFSPVNEFGYGAPTGNTFSIHQYAGSWYEEEQIKTKNRIADNYRFIMERMNAVNE